MLPVHPAKRFPHLHAYVHHARSRAGWRRGRVSRLAMRAAGAGWLALSAPLAFLAHPVGAVAGSLALGVGLAGAATLVREPLSLKERMVQEAAETATRIGQLMERHRLHRDLDPASLALLEEAARIWDEDRRAGHSADMDMAALLRLYSPCLPHSVPHRGALDWVAEAHETFVLREADRRPAPPWFGEARAIVEAMREAGRETRTAWHELDDEGPRSENRRLRN